MNKSKTVIFGASVTQQREGYATRLKSMFPDDVHIFGYGGMHLKDAGICFIDEVLQQNPSYCFIDWFSTDYSIIDKRTIEYINTIIHRFSEKKCKLIFLFFPRKDYKKKEKFNLFCKQYLKQKKIYYIDLYDTINLDTLDSVLRDVVHSNDKGSNLYADIIYNKYIEDYDKIKIPENTIVTKYNNIKKIKINKVFDKSINLEGDCEIVGFYLTVGPHSGIVEIVHEQNIKKFNTWDRWCHYSREHFSVPCTVEGEVGINISQENFDTSTSCKEYNYIKKEKKLIVHDIYFVGNFLKIKNKNEGKRICKVCSLYKKVILQIKQYVKVLLVKRGVKE